MTKPHKLAAHGPLEQLEGNLWRVEGSIPDMPLGRVMVIARMADGGLVIHNGIAVDEATFSQIEALGAPRYLVVPNGWHRLDAGKLRARWPSIRVVAPSGGRKRVEKVVPVDLTYEQFQGDGVVWFETLAGLNAAEGVMFVKSADGVSAVFTDAVFNLPKRFPGVWGFVFHDVMGSKPGPRVTRVARTFMVKDKYAFRAHLETIAETPGLRRVIVGHGAMESASPLEMLHTAAATVAGGERRTARSVR